MYVCGPRKKLISPRLGTSKVKQSNDLIKWEEEAVSQYDESKPWNRQPLDDDQGWQLFRLYLMLPLPRSLSLLGQRHKLGPLFMRKRCKDGYWILRAKAFDNEVHKRFQTQVFDYVDASSKDYAAQHMELLSKAGILAGRELDKLLRASIETEALGLIKPGELIKLLDLTVKLGRLVHGESTEKFELGSLDHMSLDEIQKLKNLQQKARK